MAESGKPGPAGWAGQPRAIGCAAPPVAESGKPRAPTDCSPIRSPDVDRPDGTGGASGGASDVVEGESAAVIGSVDRVTGRSGSGCPAAESDPPAGAGGRVGAGSGGSAGAGSADAGDSGIAVPGRSDPILGRSRGDAGPGDAGSINRADPAPGPAGLSGPPATADAATDRSSPSATADASADGSGPSATADAAAGTSGLGRSDSACCVTESGRPSELGTFGDTASISSTGATTDSPGPGRRALSSGPATAAAPGLAWDDGPEWPGTADSVTSTLSAAPAAGPRSGSGDSTAGRAGSSTGAGTRWGQGGPAGGNDAVTGKPSTPSAAEDRWPAEGDDATGEPGFLLGAEDCSPTGTPAKGGGAAVRTPNSPFDAGDCAPVSTPAEGGEAGPDGLSSASSAEDRRLASGSASESPRVGRATPVGT
jgi:hypothetical protein